MKRRAGLLAVSSLAVVVIALLIVFAVALANTQARAKHDVESRVHERAVLAAALIDSLFESASEPSQVPATYSRRVVTSTELGQHKGDNEFLALYSSTDKLLAATPGFTASDNAAVARSGVLGLVETNSYALGNIEPDGKGGTASYAITISTPYGKRILVTGFAPQVLSAFLLGDLRKIPGVKGAHNFLIDGDGRVLASTDPQKPAGYVFRTAAQKRALSLRSGDRHGRYYDVVNLGSSTWRVVLSAPNGALFASVSGVRKWIPWVIFIAFALTAIAVLSLLLRLLSTTEQLRAASRRSEALNRELASTNLELEQRAAELLRSNADLEHFASIASHDLQEPLRKVRTYTEQLTEMEADHLSVKGVEYLRRANSAAERMQQLTEDLLRYSRLATQGREFAPVDLDVLVHDVLDDLSAQVERTGARIEVGVLPTVMGDETQLRQLLQNLLSNAMKFHRSGAAPEVSVRGEVGSDGATVVITDNGIGFEPQYRERIFRVFERLNGRSEYPGTGIGLALCRKIAERHGGEVYADSTLGQGSTFTVTLPTNPRTPANGPPSSPPDLNVAHAV
jgi:signal transduction histidine kinase